MKEEKEKKDEEYVEVSLMEYIKYSKPFHIVCLAIVLCLMTSGILYQQIEIMNLQSDLKEVADNANYDLDRHAKTETTDEIELKAETLMSTDWFKKNTIEEPTSKKSVFSSKKSEYYVYLYKDDCIFCKQTEAHMFEKLESMKKKNIYFADITDANDESDKDASKKKEILWAEESDEREVYTTTKDDLAISGTPTMVKVNKNKKSVTVYVGLDAIEKELGIN